MVLIFSVVSSFLTSRNLLRFPVFLSIRLHRVHRVTWRCRRVTCPLLSRSFVFRFHLHERAVSTTTISPTTTTTTTTTTSPSPSPFTMGLSDLYSKFPFQTGTLSVIVLGLVGPMVAALLGATKTLNLEILHDKRDSYRAQDKILEFAVTFYSVTDIALAGFLTTQLRSPNTTSLRASWIAVATHQVSYLLAAVSSFGFQKTMLPSLGIAGLATCMAITTTTATKPGKI